MKEAIGILFGLAVFSLLFSFTIVPAGKVGMVMQFGTPTGRLLEPGLSLKTPFIQSVRDTNLRVTKDEAVATAATKDLQDVTIKVAVNRRLDKNNVIAQYNKVGAEKNIDNVVVQPAVQEAVKQVSSQYTAEELITKRDEVKNKIDDALKTRLSDYYVVVEDVLIVNFDFSKDFNAAIEAKQVAEQRAKQAKLEVEQVRQEAEKYKLQSEQLNSMILQKMWIEKWNGVLPQVVSDKSLIQYQSK